MGVGVSAHCGWHTDATYARVHVSRELAHCAREWAHCLRSEVRVGRTLVPGYLLPAPTTSVQLNRILPIRVAGCQNYHFKTANH